jgi:hypothetical protein
VRDLHRDGIEPPTSTAVAEAVGVPEAYSGFIEQRLELNERRGLVTRNAVGRWLLTPYGATLAVGGAAASPSVGQ